MTPLSPIDRWPRRLWLAGLLTVLMPGLGHIYCGRVRRGLLIWSGLLAVAVAAALAWARWLFVPVGPLIVAGGAWIALQVVLWADLAGFVERHGADYRLRPVNHGLSYLAIFLGLGVLPLTVVGVVVERFMVSSLVVDDGAMFPHLLPGDRVLFERGAFDDRPPRPGDLVVVAADDRAQVTRVVAAGGETVHLRDARPVIDGVEPAHEPVDGLAVPLFGPELQTRLDALRGFLERRGEHDPYVVTYDRVARRTGPDPAPASLAADEIFVLGDNRDEALSRRAYGRVPLRAVQGRPRYIWVSLGDDGLRSGRVGLELH